MKRFLMVLSVLFLLILSCSVGSRSLQKAEDHIPLVYMVDEISPEALVRIYEALDHPLPGKVAVKISTGEPGGTNFLQPDFIKNMVQTLDATIVECNTAYGGPRSSSESHKQVARDHGFTAIAPVDIMDEEGSMVLPYEKGIHINENYVGSHYANYDSYVILSHFKGHAMGGFGGAIKNMSIGIASAPGKMWIHTAGMTKETGDFGPAFQVPHDHFLESMAEAAGSIVDNLKGNIVYINVMNNLSVDCDCDSHPADPTMSDIGILASLDPVALDQACVDRVYAAHDGHDLIERMESRNGMRTLEHADSLKVGTRQYKLVYLSEGK